MPTNIFDMQDTWNAGTTTFYAIRMNVNPAAYAVGSRLLELAVNNIPRFAVDPVNGVLVGDVAGGMKGPGTVNAASYYINGNLFDPTVLQPLDPDLTAIAALTGVNTIYYRSGANTWSPVTMGPGLSFVGGSLSATGSGFAPVTSEYITSVADAALTNERVLTDTVTVAWDRTTPGQIKANTIAGGGNVSAVPTPVALQYARWVNGTSIEGRTPAQVLSDIGAAPAGSFVLKSGDTMSGSLQINSIGPTLALQRANNLAAQVLGQTGAGLSRWVIQLGTVTAESGGNAGSDFAIQRFNDAGGLIDAALAIGRQSGTLAVNAVVALGDITISKIQPLLILDKAASGQTAGIQAKMAGLPRWQMNLGGTGAESGGDAGSNFELVRSHDNGTQIDTAFTINRQTGIASVSVSPTPATDSTTKVATTQFVQQAIAAALATASAWTTGDAKLTMKTVADPTWVMMNDGTIGNQFSGGTTRANTDCLPLFLLLWNNIADVWCPVTPGGRGSSAQSDFDLNKAIKLPKQLGRSICVGGVGAGLTARATGGTLGAETHTQTGAELFAHGHTPSDPSHLHGPTGATYFQVGNGAVTDFGLGSGFGMYTTNSVGPTTAYSGTGITIPGAGSSSPMDIMNPSSYWNVMMKL